ncbi:HAD-IC family P-type ATPase [Lacrimispora sp. NSJ-141]|uniref:HAD-IC family P-type ATPase n=1 Tax=Lientehia hominis TaxID=2897778 RepID=A0AAP2W9L8_9FIRM|nr:HAD-IC family P-type ATPase [Lientehia hominis]MCD2493510.1 HAD-IC family P-type ATPase [Lientehia hominis]
MGHEDRGKAHLQKVPVIYSEPDRGLTDGQVKDRKQAGLQNLPVEAPSKTTGQIIVGNVFTFFNLIFAVLAVCLILVRRYKQMLFLIAVVVNAVIGIIQQLRSKRVVDQLSLLSASRFHVIRDGKERELASEELVRDDVVVFKAGCQIPADAAVLDGEVRVSEALITGEADAVYKQKRSALKSGSFVLSGKCRARLTHVGEDSYVSRLTMEAKKKGFGKKSEMMDSLDRILHVIAVLLIPLGLLLFWKQHWIMELDIPRAAVAVIAALVGMIPEGLYLLTSVALALSVMRLGKNRTVVHEMSCIETLARVDVLCVDKTGTITEPSMRVHQVVYLDEEHYSQAYVTEMLNAFYTQMEADNETAMAMRRYFGKQIPWEVSRKIPFQSSSKWSAVAFRGKGTFVVGAPEVLLRGNFPQLSKRIGRHSRRGERIILVGEYLGQLDEGRPLTGTFRPAAYIVIANNIRENAAETFRFFREQGVIVKVISGDNPEAVSKVAQRAAIAGAENYIDARTLETEESIEKAAERYTVFGRVTPEQKRSFIKALKKAGHTVAMTGDGVNDVLALKDADCGVAMASGSDAACHAAHLVLLDSDFASMPKVVAEGRRVINNIERAAALFLVKNIFSFLVTIVLLFAPLPYPLTPIQLTMISGFTIGIPSFFLALEPNEGLIRGKFIYNVLAKAFPGGLTNVCAVLTVSVACKIMGYPVEVMNTMAGITVGFVGILVLAQVCCPFDGKRFAIWASMAAAMALNVVLFGKLYSLVLLTFSQLLVLLVIMGASYPFLMLMSRLVPTVITRWNGRRQKYPRTL